MKYYVVKYSDNWADEIDVEGIVVICESVYKQLIENFNTFCNDNFETTHFYGTNEYDYMTFKDFWNCLTFTEITKEEANVLDKYTNDLYKAYYVLIDLLNWDELKEECEEDEKDEY